MELKKIKIQRYRSIKKLELSFQDNLPVVICGANNVGKTNFLRALQLYFSLNANNFLKERDLPEDIIKGSDYINNHEIDNVSNEFPKVKEYIEDLCKE